MQLQLRELLLLGQEQQLGLGQQLGAEPQLGEQLQLGAEQLQLGVEQLVRGAGEQLPGEQLGGAGRRILFVAWSRWSRYDMVTVRIM